jgi:hypothetical protein
MGGNPKKTTAKKSWPLQILYSLYGTEARKADEKQ